jgi:hypothetical protein
MYFEVGDIVSFTDGDRGREIVGARVVAKIDSLIDGRPGFIAVVQKRRTWGLAADVTDVSPHVSVHRARKIAELRQGVKDMTRIGNHRVALAFSQEIARLEQQAREQRAAELVGGDPG